MGQVFFIRPALRRASGSEAAKTLEGVAYFERRGFKHGEETDWSCLGDVRIVDNRIDDEQAYQEFLQQKL